MTVWNDHPDLTLGELTLEDYNKKVENLDKLSKAIGTDELKLKKKLINRQDAAQEISKLNTRFRNVVRGQIGPDSSEYGQVGGTRTSERKPFTRRSKVEVARP